MSRKAPPVVLVFGGTDPTSGAGVQADALTLAALGCHPATVVTAVTAQDTANIKQFSAVEPELVIAQARAVLEDMPVAAVKVGMLATGAIVSAIATILDDYPNLPVVIDPVQVSGQGDPLADESLDEALRTLLLPYARLVTPNSLEARTLAPDADTLDACAQQLMSLGTDYVLVTGTHEPTPEVIHRLYGNRRLIDTFRFERLPGNYHGSGCTLASACAASLAHGLEPVHAVSHALAYTWHTLKHGYRAGMGQLVPDRLFNRRQVRSADEPGQR